MLLIRDIVVVVFFVLAACLAILLSPIWLPILLLSDAAKGRRIHLDAERFSCPACGMVVGREGVRLADEEWELHLDGLEALYPGSRPREDAGLVRWLHAICPNCGKRFSYLSQTRRFRPELKAAPYNPEPRRRHGR